VWPGWGAGTTPGPAGSPAPRGWSRRHWIGLVLGCASLGALAGGAAGYWVAGRSQETIVERFSPNAPPLARPVDVQAVLATVEPAVVSISTTARVHGATVVGTGSGMVLTSDGQVLTNDHVIAGASTVTVTLLGQTQPLPATVVGTDPGQDLALIQVEGVRGLPTVHFGDSDRARVGDTVLAIGNALGLSGGPTVTEGILSSTDRSLSVTSDLGGRSQELSGLLQTDAAINAGNSGGPLVDSSGRVIGMNTAVAESERGVAPAQGIGFAIAVDTIKPLLARLRRGGTVGNG